MAMKPDIHGMAIEIAAKKGFKPKDAEPAEEPVSPDQLDDANEIMGALKTNDATSFAKALCNFLDSYHGGDDDTEPAPAAEPSAPPEE